MRVCQQISHIRLAFDYIPTHDTPNMRHLFIFALLAARLSAMPLVETMSVGQLDHVNTNWLATPNHDSKWVDYTGSMRPYLVGGETLLVEKRRLNTLVSIHDLVIYRSIDNRLIVHEVIDSKNGYLLIAGLNNWRPDGWYPVSSVLWIVRRVIRANDSTELGSYGDGEIGGGVPTYQIPGDGGAYVSPHAVSETSSTLSLMASALALVALVNRGLHPSRA